VSFSVGAGRLAGVAAWLLGWRPDEFWRATPDELSAVMAAAVMGAGGDAGAIEGVDGAELARLRAAFPDI
jgi:hypothetical protein